jgi:hypothetical protein
MARKRSKQSEEPNVYYNKSNGSRGKYRTGLFHSHKNGSMYPYRSAYEYAYYTKLEKDNSVIEYVVEPFQIPYIDDSGKRRTYKPDIIVLYHDGMLEVVEIKPKAMVGNLIVQRKAAAAKQFLARNYKHVSYKFITEEEIFETYKEYVELVKTL